MGHDIHFLERLSRVEAQQTDLALRLYRDPELVRDLLARVTFPAETDRVAIALDHTRDAPHVIVARNGHFVTCLGKGMKVGDLPIISRARVDSEARALAEVRRAVDTAARVQEERPDGWRGLFSRLGTAGGAFTREEFVELKSLSALLFRPFSSRFLPQIKSLQSIRGTLFSRQPTDDRDDLLRQYWFGCWNVTHQSVIAFAPWALGPAGLTEVMTRMARIAIPMALDAEFAPLLIRQMLAVAEYGKPALPSLKELASNQADGTVAVLAGATLTALAVRHPKHRAEVEKFLMRSSTAGGIELLNAFHSGTGKSEVAADSALVSEAEHASLLLPPPGEERRKLAAARYANIPFDLNPDVILDITFSMPWLAGFELEDLHLPRAYQSVGFPYLPRLVDQWLELARPRLMPTPEHYAPKVGRNEPCPCESGRKYKKCCGAPKAA